MKEKLIYLAGLIDGEACLGMYKRKGKTAFYYVLEIESPSIRMTSYLQEILTELKIDYTVEKDRWKKLSKRPSTKIRVCKKQQLLNLLILIEPYLHVKLPELKVLKEVLEKACAVRFYTPTEYDYQLLDKLKSLKRTC